MTTRLNKLTTWFLTLAMVITFMPSLTTTALAADDLTVTIDTGASVTLKDADADGYYDIGTADELYAFAALINGGNTAINGELTANIVINTNVLTEAGELNGTPERVWTPIGSNTNYYVGTFDGGEHTVSGLYFNNSETSYVGLFGYVSTDGVVKNVGVVDSYISGSERVGGVVGYIYNGTMTSCYNTGSVSGYVYVGGVVGRNTNGDVTNCYNTGSVSGDSNVGGVTGYNYGSSTNCYNTGSVSGDLNVGGVTGYNDGSSTNCYNTGSIRGTSGSNDIGGVVGYNKGSVTRCYNTGSIDGADSYYDSCIGGVVGTNKSGNINNCYNTGSVVGRHKTGGVAGYMSGSVFSIRGSYNTGTVSSVYTSARYVGGVVGFLEEGTVSNSYYITGCATDAGGTVHTGIGCNTPGSSTPIWSDPANGMTEEQFASGEVAYLLQGEQSKQIWGQNIDNGETVQTLPVLSDATVYAIQNCKNETLYSNTNENIGHKWENGICTVCGKVCTHESYENGICTICGHICSHAGGTATCTEQAKCEICGIAYGETDPYNHSGPFEARFIWYSTSNVEAGLFCVCQQTIGVNWGTPELIETVAATDCQNPGKEVYTVTITLDGTEYSDTKEYPIYSENHIGEFIDGFCSACDGYQAPVINDNGTADYEYDDCYEIHNAGQLFWFANYINNVSNDAYAKLMKDITVPDGKEWTPILDFYGTFDGNGKTVSGLNSTGNQYVGMFGGGGYSYGTIKNLHLSDSTFTGTRYVGGIAGYHAGTIENCYVDATVSANGENMFGALIGYASGTVMNCYAYGSTCIGGYDTSYSTVENCYYLSETDDGNGGKTAEQFASGEIAYLLQGEQSEHIWGQSIGTDMYPVLGGTKVLFANDSYYNGVMEFAVTENGVSGNKATATVVIPTAGTYTLIFADYDGERLNASDAVTVTVTADKVGIITVETENDITLSKDDRIMLWNDMTNFVPLCETYVVK